MARILSCIHFYFNCTVILPLTECWGLEEIEHNSVCAFRISNSVADGERIQRQLLHKEELSAMTEGSEGKRRGTFDLGGSG